MKRYSSLFIIMMAILIASCDKSLHTVEPDFQVTGYAVTDGVDSLGNPVKNVTFSFAGDAKIVSLYTGEVGHDYSYKEGRTLSFNDLLMFFTTTWQYGNQVDQLSVQASTDFNGKYTLEDIEAATWIDITNRFTLASNRGSTTPTPSDEYEAGVDITDLKQEGKPLYIGFKYVHNPANGTHSTWRIRSLLITGETELGNTTLADQTTAGWSLVNGGPEGALNAGLIEGGSVINLRGTAANTTTIANSWAITKAFNVSKNNLGPDRPVSVKAYTDPELSSYTYQYAQPGNYTVVFVAQNSTIQENKQVVRAMDIVIN